MDVEVWGSASLTSRNHTKVSMFLSYSGCRSTHERLLCHGLVWICRACMRMHGQYLLWTPGLPRMHAHTRHFPALATTCTACTRCPPYANLLEPYRSIRALPPPILHSANQIWYTPFCEISLVHFQSANQILHIPAREIRLVHLQSTNQILHMPVHD